VQRTTRPLRNRYFLPPHYLVNIETNPEYVKFSVEGDIGNGSIQINANEGDRREDQTVLNIDESVNLSFALRYLNMFNKAASLSSSVTLMMSSDQPLVTEFKIENLGYIKYYLAPKISDES
jgi:proliferating cell nuclear antigen